MGSVHDGHRARMRQRFLEQGLDRMADHEALELLLYYAIPRMDVNPLAHRLIHRFGSLRGVLDAPEARLREEAGVGESAAALLLLVRELGRRYLMQAAMPDKHPVLRETEAAGAFFLPYFLGLQEERVYAAFLDDAFRVLDCRLLCEGGINAAAVSTRRLVELALAARATNLILAHNHPAGEALPSVEDRQTTLALRRALEAVQIHLLDHIIVAGQQFLSMEENNYFRED